MSTGLLLWFVPGFILGTFFSMCQYYIENERDRFVLWFCVLAPISFPLFVLYGLIVIPIMKICSLNFRVPLTYFKFMFGFSKE